MKTTFSDRLIAINRLDRLGFRRWLFYPGMLFCSRSSWWGAGRPRPFTHEGADLFFFEADGAKTYRLDPSIIVPVMGDVVVEVIIDDFIGQTVVCRHLCGLGTGAPVWALYAHVVPLKGLRPGSVLSEGQGIAHIAPADPQKTPLPPHLHVSVLRMEALPSPLPRPLDWAFLNRLDRDAFFDPLPLAGIREDTMRIIDFDPAMGGFDEIIPRTV